MNRTEESITLLKVKTGNGECGEDAEDTPRKRDSARQEVSGNEQEERRDGQKREEWTEAGAVPAAGQGAEGRRVINNTPPPLLPHRPLNSSPHSPDPLPHHSPRHPVTAGTLNHMTAVCVSGCDLATLEQTLGMVGTGALVKFAYGSGTHMYEHTRAVGPASFNPDGQIHVYNQTSL